MMKKAVLTFLALTAIAQLSRAQPSNCSDGTVLDDGGFETGFQPSTVLFRGEMAMRIPPPSTPARLESACVCFIRDTFGNTSVNFDLRVWAADGPGGSPGSLLGELPNVRLTNIGFNGRFTRVDLSSLNLVVNNGVYVGPSWFPGSDDVFVCADESPSTPKQRTYLGIPALGGWSEMGRVGSAPNLRALGIRAKYDTESVPTGGCTPDETTLCLVDRRFEVKVDWRTPQGTTGVGMAKALTPDTGYFWFFNEENVEMVIKVLNACSFADHFWVFAGGLTNVEVHITVTDTERTETKTYDNLLGEPFQPIQDTNAFATCP